MNTPGSEDIFPLVPNHGVVSSLEDSPDWLRPPSTVEQVRGSSHVVREYDEVAASNDDVERSHRRQP